MYFLKYTHSCVYKVYSAKHREKIQLKQFSHVVIILKAFISQDYEYLIEATIHLTERFYYVQYETVQRDRVIIITGDLTYTKSLIYNITW